MLAFNADNATSNNKQTVNLARKKNTFEECNHGHCFNHTVQLAAKALIKLFTACISSATTEDDDVASDDNMVEVEAVEDNDDDDTLWDKDDVSEAFDEVEDDIDEMNELDDKVWEKLLEDTAVVRQAVSKVRIQSRVARHIY
jgi:hypothetical protein